MRSQILQPDPVQERLDSLTQYLESNGAKIFADDLRDRLDSLELIPRLTAILAPTNFAILEFSRNIGRRMDDVMEDPRFLYVLDNHVSVLPLLNTPPFWRAINGIEYGWVSEDLAKLGIRNTQIIAGVTVIIINSVLYRSEQIGYFKKTVADLDKGAFRELVVRGRIRGENLLALCRTTATLHDLCTKDKQYIFRRLLHMEFGVDLNFNCHLAPATFYENCLRDDELLESIRTKLDGLDEYIEQFHRELTEYDGYDLSSFVLQRRDVFDLLYNADALTDLTGLKIYPGAWPDHRGYQAYGLNEDEMDQFWRFLWHASTDSRENPEVIRYGRIGRPWAIEAYAKGLYSPDEIRDVMRDDEPGEDILNPDKSYREKFLNFPRAFVDFWLSSIGMNIAPLIEHRETELLKSLWKYTEVTDENAMEDDDLGIFEHELTTEEIDFLNRLHQGVKMGKINIFQRLNRRLVGVVNQARCDTMKI